MDMQKQSKALLFLFNHSATEDQLSDARHSLGVNRFIEPPADIQKLWRKVPPELESIATYLEPVQNWLVGQGAKGDFALIQGDFGATFLMVRFALNSGLVPLYSTTDRRVTEHHDPDGSVHLVHTFKHHRFRKYEEAR
jgi:hypothetical protein